MGEHCCEALGDGAIAFSDEFADWGDVYDDCVDAVEQVDEDPDLGVVHGFYEIFFKAVVEIEF